MQKVHTAVDFMRSINMPYVDTAITNLTTLHVDRFMGVNYYTDDELICGACVHDVLLWESRDSRPDHRIR